MNKLLNINVIYALTISLFFCIFVSENIMVAFASDISTLDRRLGLYPSITQYLEKTASSKRILIIGGGLSYDDLVKDSENRIFQSSQTLRKERLKFYPPEALLIDLENELNYYGEEWEAPSHSDLQADITLPIGSEGEINGLPQELVGKFDIVVLENLSFKALTSPAFTNVWALLQPGGLLVSNNYLSTTTLEIVNDPRSDVEFHSFTITDKDNHKIAIFVSNNWIDDFETSKFFLYPTTPEAKVNLIENAKSSEYIRHLYQGVFDNPSYIDFIKESFRRFIPTPPVEVVRDTEYWYGVPELHGYLIWKKP